MVRSHIRNIAPAPISQQQQQQRQPKTLVLKTIPLKVKQVAPTTIKMPPRQTSQGVPHNIVHQQPTEVMRYTIFLDLQYFYIDFIAAKIYNICFSGLFEMEQLS